MFIDAVHAGDDIITWVRDDVGALHMLTDPAPYYAYVKDDNGTEMSMFGDKVKRHDFQTRGEYNRFVDSHIHIFESDITALHKHLSDTYFNAPDHTPNVGFLDIETDYDLKRGTGYPTPDNPFGIINALSLYDKTRDEFHLLYVHNVPVRIDTGEDVVHMHQCQTERQLLDIFFILIEDIDILSGWNSEGYDIPYIVLRSRMLYGEAAADRKFCRAGFKLKEQTGKDKFYNERTKYVLVGRVHLDYMELYEKFTFIQQPSMKLENIAQAELGYGKINYDGDLGELYRTDIKKFLEYNLHDSRLLRDLEEKKKLIQLAVQMSRKATIKINEVMGTIKFLEHAIRNYAHFERAQPIVLPDRGDGDKEGKFIGAWVADPVTARYGWASSIDLASLYPAILRSLGMSPETFIMQCDGREADFLRIIEGNNDEDGIIIHMKQSGDVLQTTPADLRELIKEEGYTMSANGSIFNGEVGLIPEVLGVWFAERKRTKNMSKEFFKNGDKEKGLYYDMLQYIYKVQLNSLYGAISNKYSRFFDLDIAISVTLTGQYINKFQAWKSDQLMREVNEASK